MTETLEPGDWAIYHSRPEPGIAYEVLTVYGRIARVKALEIPSRKRWTGTIGVHALAIIRKHDGRVFDPPVKVA